MTPEEYDRYMTLRQDLDISERTAARIESHIRQMQPKLITMWADVMTDPLSVRNLSDEDLQLLLLPGLAWFSVHLQAGYRDLIKNTDVQTLN